MNLDPHLVHGRPAAAVELACQPPIEADPELPPSRHLDEWGLLCLPQRAPPEGASPFSRVLRGHYAELEQSVVGLSPAESLDSAEKLGDVPDKDARDAALEKAL